MNRSREEALEKIGPIKIIEALESSLLKAIEDNSKLEAEIDKLKAERKKDAKTFVDAISSSEDLAINNEAVKVYRHFKKIAEGR